MPGFRTFERVHVVPPFKRPATAIVDRRLLYSAAEWSAMEAEAKARAEAAALNEEERLRREECEARAALQAGAEAAVQAAQAAAPTGRETRRQRILNIQPLAPGGQLYASADLIRLVAVITDVPEAYIKSTCHDPHYVKARHITFWLLRTFTDASLPQIGRRCGGRDHTTVLYGWRKAEAVSEGIADFDRTQPRLAAASLWALPWPKVSGYKLKKRGRA